MTATPKDRIEKFFRSSGTGNAVISVILLFREATEKGTEITVTREAKNGRGERRNPGFVRID